MQIEGTFYKVVIHYDTIDKTVYAEWLGTNKPVKYVDSVPDIGDSDSWNHSWFTKNEVHANVLPLVKKDHPDAAIYLEVIKVEVADSIRIMIQ